MSQGPVGKLIHGVTSSIGLASEVHGYRKAKKAARKERELEQQQQQQPQELSVSPSQSPPRSPARSPPPYAASPEEQDGTRAEGPTVDQGVERTWQLDEAQDAIVEKTKPRKSKSGVANPDKVLAAFLQRRPPPETLPDSMYPGPRLTYPVAIPQRRPKDKSRGFVRAYAPELQNMRVDQETWLDFIETFNEAILANPWINALNLASLAAAPLPSLISTAISTAIMVATTVAIETQGRYRQNKALDRLNDEFFRPRGLYCLVMTWDPTSSSARTNLDINTTIQNTMDSQGKMSHKFQTSNGVTNGMESMQTAQLIFPDLDFLATATKDEEKGFKKKLGRGKDFIDDYNDRRAQAKFYAENPTSYLNQAGKPKFLSKYGDPTHPMHNGLSGGILGGNQQGRGFGRGGGLGGMGMDRGIGGGGLLGLVSLATQAVSDHRQRNATNRGNPHAPYGDSPRPYGEREQQCQQARGANSGYYDERGQQHYQQQYEQQHYQQQPYQQPQQQYQQTNFRAGTGAGAGGLSLSKLFSAKVLYLMVVNMPTEEEMAQAQRLTAGWNLEGQQQRY
ncbi:uncharacterized protein BO80DRAFT_500468 [Aspergillus ibericus CBS 121593]|uniref:Uncharacterized protein n=1 Tax=Aspergillus ibericus CBS 121593 TaxID=1448316 RepID=A0A395H5I6_9EURO|nr:hypothetical protein BO80DRAFT_500468 [Aspergillus ibericus CBS 121593]RAL03141.1 hypothetical protein BO80DRAFT_500468 [Aspergillus ibericus CBS 121593]